MRGPLDFTRPGGDGRQPRPPHRGGQAEARSEGGVSAV